MSMEDKRVGFALTGSFCTFARALEALEQVAGRYPALKRQYLATFTLCNLVFLVPLYFL